MRRGFTLIEIMLYIGIATMVLAAAVALLAIVLEAREKDQLIGEVEGQGAAAMQFITQDLRSATAINSPSASGSGNQLSLNLPAPATNPTVFSLNNGSLQVSAGGAQPGSITDAAERVIVNNLQFSNLSVSSTTGSVRVRFTITGSSSSSWYDYQYTKTFVGSASLRSLSGSGSGGSGSSITVNADNVSYCAPPDAFTYDPRVNDTTSTGSISITGVTQPSHGSTTFSPTSITYTRNAGYVGSDSYSYTATNGTNSGTANESMTVSACNTPPTAVNDAVTITRPTTSTTFDPRVNDSDADGDTLTIIGVTQPSHGTSSFTATGVTYTVIGQYVGTDSFTYTISDGHGYTATATITVTINSASQTPPTAVNDFYDLAGPRYVITFDPKVNDYDTDGDALSVISVDTPANGTAVINASNTITYRLTNPGFTGDEIFNYTISDGHGLTSTASIDIYIERSGGGGCTKVTCQTQ